MTRYTVLIVVGFVALCAAGPMLVVLLHDVVPVVLALAFAAALVRLIWWLTSRG